MNKTVYNTTLNNALIRYIVAIVNNEGNIAIICKTNDCEEAKDAIKRLPDNHENAFIYEVIGQGSVEVKFY